jgi:dihydroorotase-like cyclic amidohydrolase
MPSETGFRSKSANSWLLGTTLQGTVAMTMAAGRTAYSA